jgi:hypothetical protein
VKPGGQQGKQNKTSNKNIPDGQIMNIPVSLPDSQTVGSIPGQFMVLSGSLATIKI